MKNAFLALCTAFALALPLAVSAQVLDPNAYASLGALSLDGGSYTINTDTLAFAGHTGVLSSGIAVFDFSSISIGFDTDVNVVGSHPLALLSRSDAAFGAGSVFYLNGGMGGPGQYNHQNSGLPPGGAGGTAGSGGYAGTDGNAFYLVSSGGGFGGGGGHYGSHIPGPTYGNLLTKLEGGQGGGGGSGISGGQMAVSGAGGGGGGGAIEISAVKTVTLAGSINAVGGNGGFMGNGLGGGGAGGGVLLAGNRVTLANTGHVYANGGAGGYSSYEPHSGGGGGGGRITVQTVDPNGFAGLDALNVKGGRGNFAFDFDDLSVIRTYISNGGDGVITVNGRVVNTPAPGSLLVFAVGLAGGAVRMTFRRRRKK